MINELMTIAQVLTEWGLWIIVYGVIAMAIDFTIIIIVTSAMSLRQ